MISNIKFIVVLLSKQKHFMILGNYFLFTDMRLPQRLCDWSAVFKEGVVRGDVQPLQATQRQPPTTHRRRQQRRIRRTP